MYRRRLARTRGMNRPIRWSHETCFLSHTWDMVARGNVNAVLIPAVNNQGNRKARNMRLNIMTESTTAGVAFVVVYVPAGTVPSEIGSGEWQHYDAQNVTGNWSSVYEPNQNVLMSGVLPHGTSVSQTFIYSGQRTLASGDRIVVVFKNNDNAANNMGITLTFDYWVAF